MYKLRFFLIPLILIVANTNNNLSIAQSVSSNSTTKNSIQLDKSKITEAAAPVKLQFSHTPPKLEDLPSPGLPLKLSVRVNKEALSSGVLLRAIITRDGTLFEQQNTSPQIDASDRIGYIIEVPSPLVEMSYQFVFIDKAGNAVGTKRYNIRRNCIPDVIFPSNTKDNAEPSVEELRKTTEKLESEIALLDLATTSITQLQEAIDKK
jgi:hypothetical protein